MKCKYCGEVMVRYDDEGSFTVVRWDAYICPNCLGCCFKETYPSQYEDWTEFKYGNLTTSLERAIHTLVRAGYRLEKRKKG